MKRNIIGVTGAAFAGKDTLAKMICEETGYSQYALATPIKQTINSLFGWDERHSNGVMKEQEQYTRILHTSTLSLILGGLFDDMDGNNLYTLDFIDVFKPFCIYDLHGLVQYRISPRKAYQLFGTEFGRKCVADTVWLDMIPDGNVVISDVRYDNEAEYIARNGGRIVQVVSNRATTKENEHSSENGIDISYISATIENNGSLEELKEKAIELCNLIT